MPRDPDMNIFRVGGIPIADIDMAGLIASMGRYLRRGPLAPGGYVAFCGAHGVVECQDEPRIRDAHERAWLVVPDGRPLTWIGRMRGCRRIAQVPGIESVEKICRAGVEAGWRHYFVGGGPGVAARLAATMMERVPGLRVVGSETPPFRPLTAAEGAEMRARMRDAGAQIVWVGLSTPKQELFMAEHSPHLPGTMMMGVGAAFDVNIGTIARAPKVFQVVGLEWAYRLAREPARLWPRYSVVVPRFLRIALGDFVRV